MPDPTSCFCSVFQRRHGLYCTKPTWIWSGWSGQGLVKHIRKQAGVQESLGPVSDRTQPPRYQFSHLQTRFCSSRDDSDNIVQNQPASDFGWLCRFWPNGSGLEASQCSRIIWPTSGHCFPADLDQMPIRSGMFTGNTLFRIKISPWCPVSKLQVMYTDRTCTSQFKQKYSVWVIAKEAVRNSWEIFITILGHKYHQKTFSTIFWVTNIIRIIQTMSSQ